MNLFIGLMSGTSMDAVDAVLVDFDAHLPRIHAMHTHRLNDELRNELRSLAHPGVNELERCAQLDVRIGRLFAEASLALLSMASVEPAQVTAIGSHGQTVRHNPGAIEAFSVQIGDPAVIAEQTGITTVADFRRRDIAAGGQGAPLVPAFHNAVFRSSDQTRIILNIGGIANLSLLPADPALPVLGFDTGPGNNMLDAWAQHCLHQRMDEGGQWAASGMSNSALLDILLSDPYFALKPPKSTGSEYFNLPWLESHMAIFQACQGMPLSSQDTQATLCDLTAASISQAILQYASDAEEVLVCGGGVHNQTLMRQLRAKLPGVVVESTASHGVDPDWVEAVAFAWLARQTLAGKPGNLPAVTGARRAVILGGIWKADE